MKRIGLVGLIVALLLSLIACQSPGAMPDSSPPPETQTEAEPAPDGETVEAPAEIVETAPETAEVMVVDYPDYRRHESDLVLETIPSAEPKQALSEDIIARYRQFLDERGPYSGFLDSLFPDDHVPQASDTFSIAFSDLDHDGLPEIIYYAHSPIPTHQRKLISKIYRLSDEEFADWGEIAGAPLYNSPYGVWTYHQFWRQGDAIVMFDRYRPDPDGLSFIRQHRFDFKVLFQDESAQSFSSLLSYAVPEPADYADVTIGVDPEMDQDVRLFSPPLANTYRMAQLNSWFKSDEFELINPIPLIPQVSLDVLLAEIHNAVSPDKQYALGNQDAVRELSYWEHYNQNYKYGVYHNQALIRPSVLPTINGGLGEVEFRHEDQHVYRIFFLGQTAVAMMDTTDQAIVLPQEDPARYQLLSQLAWDKYRAYAADYALQSSFINQQVSLSDYLASRPELAEVISIGPAPEDEVTSKITERLVWPEREIMLDGAYQAQNEAGQAVIVVRFNLSNTSSEAIIPADYINFSLKRIAPDQAELTPVSLSNDMTSRLVTPLEAWQSASQLAIAFLGQAGGRYQLAFDASEAIEFTLD